MQTCRAKKTLSKSKKYALMHAMTLQLCYRQHSCEGASITDEDNRRRVLAGYFEQVADAGSSNALKHLHKLRAIG